MNLGVFLIEGADIPKCDPIGLSDPYCVFTISGQDKVQKSKFIENTKNPKWNESFSFFINDTNTQTLNVKVMDKDVISDDVIAQTCISLRDISPGKSIEKWYTLTTASGIQGQPKIRISLTLD